MESLRRLCLSFHLHVESLNRSFSLFKLSLGCGYLSNRKSCGYLSNRKSKKIVQLSLVHEQQIVCTPIKHLKLSVKGRLRECATSEGQRNVSWPERPKGAKDKLEFW